MTNRITAILTATRIPVTRPDSLVPITVITPSAAMTNMAPQSGRALSPASQVGRLNRFCRYADQPRDTTAAPRASSRQRSQPMIQAMNSPSVAYENVYADPATGTVDANSA